jgi:hypothetical protein
VPLPYVSAAAAERDSVLSGGGLALLSGASNVHKQLLKMNPNNFK